LSVVSNALCPLLSLDLVAPPEDEVNDHDTQPSDKFHGQTDGISHDEAGEKLANQMLMIECIISD